MAIRKILTRAIESAASSANLNIDANTLFLDSTNNRVGVNNISPTVSLDVTGAVRFNSSGEAVTIGASSLAANTAQYFRNTSGYSVLAITSAADQYLTGAVAGDFVIASNAKSLRFGNAGSGALGATLDASGKLLMGTTSNPIGSTAVFSHSGAGYGISVGDITTFTNQTGIYMRGGNENRIAWDTAGYLTFNTGGSTERARIDSSGNFGLGVTPSAWYSPWKVFQVANASVYATVGGGYFSIGSNFYTDSSTTPRYISSTYARQFTSDSSGFTFNLAPSGTAGNAIAWTAAMTLDASGNLGIGTTSPLATIHARGLNVLPASSRNLKGWIGGASSWGTDSFEELGVGYSGIRSIYTGGDSWALTFTTGSSGQFTGGTQAERARIDSAGSLILGTSPNGGVANANFALRINYPNTQNGLRLDTTSAGTALAIQFVYNNATQVGSITTTTSATNYGSGSDYRLKNNVTPLTNALEKIALLKPVNWNWKIDGTDGQGFIAHELQAVIPDAVVGEKDAVNEDGSIKTQMVDTSYLVATLTAAIQEQQVLIAQLQADVAALKAAA